MIVLPDADIDMAADAAVSAGVRLGRRALHGDLGRSSLSATSPIRWSRRSRAPAQGEGRPRQRPESEMGPLVTREHRDKVAGYLDAAREQGATVVTDGREDARFGGDGFFLGVSLIDDVRPDMTCYTDEIFGPVLSVVRASSYDEALGMVNDNPYGNGVAIFTRDGGAARQFQFDVNVGMVGVERPDPGAGRRTTRSAAGRRRSSATSTCTAPTASRSTPGRRS